MLIPLKRTKFPTKGVINKRIWPCTRWNSTSGLKRQRLDWPGGSRVLKCSKHIFLWRSLSMGNKQPEPDTKNVRLTRTALICKKQNTKQKRTMQDREILISRCVSRSKSQSKVFHFVIWVHHWKWISWFHENKTDRVIVNILPPWLANSLV